MTFLSFFAGIGGLDLGLERAGMRCVGQVEIDHFCRRVLTKHWPEVPRFGDIRELTGQELPVADVAVGGFPCPDISRMGRRAGITGARSGLWRQMVRTVRVAGIRNMLVENVAALLERGMGVVLADMATLGLDSEWDCLSPHWFGVRQRRERVFVLAYPNRWLEGQPRQRTVLPGEVEQAPFIDGQPIPNGMRVGHWASDGVDTCKRIGACANAVSPQVAEFIGRRIMEAHHA